jgi:radical SAM superfamily enzyme YgiQ (UPF0313 family)
MSSQKRVLILNPPVPNRAFTNRDLMGGMGIDDSFGVDPGPRFIALLKYEGIRLPVLSLAYAASILSDHEIVALDQSRLDPEEPGVLEAAVATKPDWVICATSYGYYGAELEFLEQIHERTGAKRLLIGYTAEFFAEQTLQRGKAEAIAVGDPETAFFDLANDKIEPGRPGVLMLDDHGQVVTSCKHYYQNLDDLPFPNWDALPISEFCYYPLLKRRPFATMLASRGCPYVCNFCPYPTGQGAPFRPRSAENIVEEMRMLVQDHGVRSILFRDPTWSLQIDHAKEICAQIIDANLKLEFGIETRLDRMDEELIELLGKAGCRSCEFGLDPLDEMVKQASNRKGILPERAASLISLMEKNRVSTAGLFVIGLPEQNIEEMHRTLDWIRTLDLSYVNYEIATPFPGTPLYDEAIERGWVDPLTIEDVLNGDPKLSFNNAIDLDEMKKLQDQALKAFYVRPGKVFSEIVNRDFFQNMGFMAKSTWKFLRSGRSR